MSDFSKKFIEGIESAKRLDVVHTPWMGDWFVSYSPRNSNSNAEGPWDHWVQLSLSILQHPATRLVRPEVFEAVQGLRNTSNYTETVRDLTEDEIEKLFGGSDE